MSGYQIPTDTVRETIIAWIMATLTNVPFNDADPTSPALFEFVKRGTINDIKRGETPSAAIEEGTERKTDDLWPFSDKMLRVFVNFKIPAAPGDDLGVDRYSLIGYYIGRITKLLVTQDQACGGLALDITEAGNTPEVNGQSDPEPGGTAIFDVHYRHRYGDMFTGM